MSNENLLQKVNSPEDLKKLTRKECFQLATEIRERIVQVVSQNGGHLSSNLGIVELTMALHRVFSTPNDVIVWDVGHQSYTHKILTGRNDQLDTIRRRDGISGFPKRSESIHDAMDTGHASTSISAAFGMLTSKRLQGKEGRAIAVIGDGALTGGMAFEALNHAGHIKGNLIIILNDNEMSIARNVGALSSRPRRGRVSSAFSTLSIHPFYQAQKRACDKFYSSLPSFFNWIKMIRHRSKKGLKAIFLKENIFSDLGFDYVGPVDGSNLKKLEKTLKRVKQINAPVVVHVLTQKGKGYPYAERDPRSYHGVGKFSIMNGKVDKKSSLTFSDCFSSILLEAGSRDSKLAAISAAMVGGTGLSAFQQAYPNRSFDVGIAEQHAVTFAAGLAAEGMHPVVAIYSTFMQRAVDQVIHDVAVPNLPVIFVMSRSGFVGDDGETHQGLFDIALFRSIPNLIFLAPSGAADFQLIFDYALKQKCPVMIRIPKSLCSFSSTLNQPIESGRGIFVHYRLNPILFVSLGGSFDVVEEAVNLLAKEGILVDHYNLRFIKPLNDEVLVNDFSNYNEVIFVEDGVKEGGVGEKLSLLFNKKAAPKFLHLGAADFFPAQATRSELFEQAKLDAVSLAQIILERQK